jgi:glycosyltransferase involved in cell wall biosynthesis
MSSLPVRTAAALPARPHSTTPAARPGRRLASVVVCTIGRHPGLRTALTSLLAQRHVPFEIIVVDNAPETGRTAAVVAELADPRLRSVTEPRRGLSIARNTGIRAARGDVIVFTDDDCRADPLWLSAIRAVLDAYPAVSCVTGRTLPAALNRPAERWFEEFGSFNRGAERRVWRWAPVVGRPELPAELAADCVEQFPPIYPYSGIYGSGNNMAFRADALRELGGFDEALGAGTPAAGGEDLDMFVRLVLAGMVVVYEPGALIRHSHRVDEESLGRQVHDYGVGLSAMITKHLLVERGGRRLVVRRVPAGLRHLLSPASAKNAGRSDAFPRALARRELVGLTRGPWRYLRGRLRLRRTPPVRIGTELEVAS